MKICSINNVVLVLLIGALSACGGGGGGKGASEIPASSSASSLTISNASSASAVSQVAVSSAISSAVSSALSSVASSTVSSVSSSATSVSSSGVITVSSSSLSSAPVVSVSSSAPALSTASSSSSVLSSAVSSVKISSSSSIATSSSLASSSSSSTASSASGILFVEHFDVDKATLFSATYRAISTDATAPLLFITAGGSGITIANNELTINAARFSIGNKPPRTATTVADTSANGDFDLSKPYRISFRVVASSGTGAVQVMVDNNTTSSGSALHGGSSRVFNAAANTLVAGETVVITPSIGTAASFIALRTESSASVTIDDLVIEYLNGSSVASSSFTSSSVKSSASSSSSSLTTSSAVASSASSISSVSSSSANSSGAASSYNGSLSNDCVKLATNSNVNWRDTSLQTDQEIVQCLSQTLGTPVGYGEKALGGFDPNGHSKLTVITKNSPKTVELQVLEAITGEDFNWIVFDKVDFAQDYEIGMYRNYCGDAGVLSLLGITSEQCVNYKQWCATKGFSDDAVCLDEFFNKLLHNSNLTIRNPIVGSNKTLDGRMNKAFFRFSGFTIGKDSEGAPVQTANSVILTHLNFKGAGHTEDHYLDPDMIRSTGASHDIWIHKNTFDLTGDSAFDVKVGAYNITMSFNKVQDVKRASLHGSSDSHTINSQTTTTMHHNAFVTTDAHYLGFGNTARRVPLIRGGKSHMFNNLFVNYRKDVLSIRVGASVLQEDNMFVVNSALKEKSSVATSLAELQSNLIKDVDGGNYRGDGIYLWFADGACALDNSTKTLVSAASGSVANLALQYSPASQQTINTWHFSAGQELEDYVSATAGKDGALPFNSPLAPDRYYVLPAKPCQ